MNRIAGVGPRPAPASVFDETIQSLGALQRPFSWSMESNASQTALSLGALGVVYGDIGTSPLYAFQSAFAADTGLHCNAGSVDGVLSLILWALLSMVSLKYVRFVLRADNRGEGGILALMALVMGRFAPNTRRRWLFVALGLVGASMFYGDSVITPAISVLSAIEGLHVASPMFGAWEVPITVGILIGLFLIQRRGTSGIGRAFGPVMLAWFVSIGVAGASTIAQRPAVLAAMNPIDGVTFVVLHPGLGVTLLGAVFLVLTGGEALYADMGHFGRAPIQRAWLCVVLPCLVLNYFGQGAEVLMHPATVSDPFFMMLPPSMLWPMLTLATAATVIASQAVISGAFSMTAQAIKLGYLPRVPIVFTSAQHRGQIYIPAINWSMLAFVLALVVSFGSAGSLASAYGFAVNVTMLVTTIFCWSAARDKWRWSPLKAALVWGGFLVIDLLFLIANSIKIAHGGWFPILFGAGVYTTLATWKRGRELLRRALREQSLDLPEFINSLSLHPPDRVEGTAVYLTPNADAVPHSLLHNLKHNKVLHERVVFLSASTAEVPHVPSEQGIAMKELGDGVMLLHVRYGFMDDPDVQCLLADVERIHGIAFHLMETSFFLARQTILAAGRTGMARWREQLFAWMSRNAQHASDYFNIPPNRVVELGAQVEI
jgi:KUP system potassium uptake protein